MSALILKDLYIMKKYCRSVLPFGAVDGGDILGRVDIHRFWEPILDIFPRDSRLGHTGDAAVI